MDNPAKLFVKHSKAVKNVSVYPEGALTLTKKGSTAQHWTEYEVKGNRWGRARLTINYLDGITQTIHYKVIKSENEVVQDLSHFLTTKQWYENDKDLFDRSPSVISYDYEEKQPITQNKSCGSKR